MWLSILMPKPNYREMRYNTQMGLMDAIRRAEEESRDAARRGMEKARATWNDTERALRRRMRVNRFEENGEAAQANSAKVRTKIVSINGRDVATEEISGARRTA